MTGGTGRSSRSSRAASAESGKSVSGGVRTRTAEHLRHSGTRQQSQASARDSPLKSAQQQKLPAPNKEESHRELSAIRERPDTAATETDLGRDQSSTNQGDGDGAETSPRDSGNHSLAGEESADLRESDNTQPDLGHPENEQSEQDLVEHQEPKREEIEHSDSDYRHSEQHQDPENDKHQNSDLDEHKYKEREHGVPENKESERAEEYNQESEPRILEHGEEEQQPLQIATPKQGSRVSSKQGHRSPSKPASRASSKQSQRVSLKEDSRPSPKESCRRSSKEDSRSSPKKEHKTSKHELAPKEDQRSPSKAQREATSIQEHQVQSAPESQGPHPEPAADSEAAALTETQDVPHSVQQEMSGDMELLRAAEKMSLTGDLEPSEPRAMTLEHVIIEKYHEKPQLEDNADPFQGHVEIPPLLTDLEEEPNELENITDKHLTKTEHEPAQQPSHEQGLDENRNKKHAAQKGAKVHQKQREGSPEKDSRASSKAAAHVPARSESRKQTANARQSRKLTKIPRSKPVARSHEDLRTDLHEGGNGKLATLRLPEDTGALQKSTSLGNLPRNPSALVSRTL